MGYIQIVLALIAYFAQKKRGASTAEAALTGLGTYWASNWVIKNTEWGQEHLGGINSRIDGWLGVDSGTVEGGVVTKSDGTVVSVPSGTVAVAQPDGSVVFVPTDESSSSGGWFTSLTEMFKDWGAQGTATVIGTAAVASNKNLLPYLIGLGAIILVVK